MLIILILQGGLCHGQEKKSSVSQQLIGYELGSYQIKEEILIPKVHRGIIHSLSYRYCKEGKHFHEASFVLGYGKLKTKLETEKVTWNGQVDLQYAMGFYLVNSQKVSFSLGFNTRYRWSVFEYPVWDESRAYWGTAVTLGPYNRFMVLLKKNRAWITTWDISLLGLLGRPDEVRLDAQQDWSFAGVMTSTQSNFTFGLVNQILISDFRTEFRLPFGDDNFVSFFYALIFQRVAKKDEPPLKTLTNNLGIGIGF